MKAGSGRTKNSSACADTSRPRWLGERFIREWQRLTVEHQISGVHMSAFYAEAKRRGWDDNKTGSVLREFCKVIRENVIVGFAVGIDTRYYKALPKKTSRTESPNQTPPACNGYSG
jgi:hypothetical protein